MKGPPDWLVSLVPYLGHRKSREAWREIFADNITLSVIFGTSFGKLVETSVVIVALGDSSQWPLWWTWGFLSVATFVMIVFSWYFKMIAKHAAERGSEVIEDGVEKAKEAVDGDGD